MKQPSLAKSLIPFLIIAFLNTFVDIGHKALMMDTVYATSNAHQYTLLSSVVNALMLLPYLFLFTFSGFIADRWPKVFILRITAFSAIPLTVFLTLCYFSGWFWLAFLTTVLMALQSVLNSPAKYGYIREAFGVSGIARLNGMVQAAVIMAIVISQAVFTFSANALVSHRLVDVHSRSGFIMGFAPIGFILIVLAALEFSMTFRLLKVPAADPSSRYQLINYVTTRYLRSYLNTAFHKKGIFVCMIGLSLFFAINQELLAIYGGYLKESVGASANFALSSIGIAGLGILIGAVLAGRISRGFIEVAMIPLATLAMCLGLVFLSHLHNPPLIIVMMLLYGVFAGFLIVPLNALIQFHARSEVLGRVLATNNFLQMLAMFSYLMIGIILIYYQFSIGFQLNILIILGSIGLLASLYFFPQSLVRYELMIKIRKYTHLVVNGLSVLSSPKGILIVGDDLNAGDWPYFQMACPRYLRLVISSGQRLSWSQRYYMWRANSKPIIINNRAEGEHQILQSLYRGEVVHSLCQDGHNQLWKEIVNSIDKGKHSEFDIIRADCDHLTDTRWISYVSVKWGGDS